MAKDSAERDHRVRMSRKYFTGGDETGSKKKVCKSVPVEECHSLRVNPRPVMKEMKRKVCRQPRPGMITDVGFSILKVIPKKLLAFKKNGFSISIALSYLHH